MGEHPLEARADAVIQANKYLTLSTVDEQGRPWATPVYFTPDGHTHLYWVSSPDSLHSRNITANPDISVAIFDSTVAIGQAQGVYLTAHAHLVPEAELADRARLFSSRYAELRHLPAEELRAPADLRLYRATVTRAWVLIRAGDPDYGTGIDTRHPVWPAE
ncbi:pyridoxamine 5'-phosphate oxidase family protein [Actinophytocola oryzae]|uniref:Nitroimidazol reductase NimA-like FMN-containing flavoprotein (Pyridoxamine 5'-phosphate oxidase superfamily) n=1 Tax=Actinophytocola oryzae TaxID=502181 RepID=A0A4R7W3V1_9PSEU|nr:pyridoxamine 5'-phosphate oxidase family protein [Actinophytocola oryzae]TDV57360.1 nitroimidazol reductase NimA-like FMN-containing flavoprotein (pyridoxamine 5'-phosphate oxidase superfamily) [Actinophytocola oryzae]